MLSSAETPPMVSWKSRGRHCLPVIQDASRQPSVCKGKRFPIVESQHRTEEENEEGRKLGVLVMLTVDSVLSRTRRRCARGEPKE